MSDPQSNGGMSEPRVIPCEEALRRIFAYLDDELEQAEKHEVEHHLERCRSCFSRAEFERRLKGHLAGLGQVEIPPSFEARIRSMIGEFSC